MAFHVPEAARILNGRLASTSADGNYGAFFFTGKLPGRELWCIASEGLDWGWEHVSTHVANRNGKLFMPTWDEMCWVKDQFWDEEDVVMQLHPAKSQWINNHPTTLHLWRPTQTPIPLPPGILVGIQGATT
jgi:hypothetical protein